MSMKPKEIRHNSKHEKKDRQLDSFYRPKTKHIKKSRFMAPRRLNKSQANFDPQKIDQFGQEIVDQGFLKAFFNNKLSQFFPQVDELSKPLQILEKLVKQEPIPLRQLLSCKQKSVIWDQKCDQIDILEYYSLLKIIDEPRCQVFTFKTEKDQFISKIKLEGHKREKMFSMLKVARSELFIIQNRYSFMERIGIEQEKNTRFSQQFEKMGSLSKEVLFLYNIYLKCLKSIQKCSPLVENFRQKLSEQKNFSQETEMPILNIYKEYLVLKNIKAAIQDKDIQDFCELNFFKRAQFLQQQRLDDYVPIQNNHSLRSFLLKKKTKKASKGRASSSLPTACEYCFSSRHELYNPISKCNYCFKRTHRMCYNNFKQCGFCFLKINRTNSQCIICPAKNLMVNWFNVSKKKGKSFIHSFCMLVHKLYKISDAGQFQIDNDLVSKLAQVQFKCSLCDFHMSAFIQCKRCGSKMHASCAYFRGYSFEMKIVKKSQQQKGSFGKANSNQSYDFDIFMDCCSLQYQEKIEENGYRRKYKLNLNKFVYKNLKQLEKPTSISVHSILDSKQQNQQQLIERVQNKQQQKMQRSSDKSIQQNMQQCLFQQDDDGLQ